jgi:hypothetical protein
VNLYGGHKTGIRPTRHPRKRGIHGEPHFVGEPHRSAPQLHDQVRDVLVQVGIDRPVAPAIHHFEKIHQIPAVDDECGGDDGPEEPGCARVACHLDRFVVLELGEMAVAQADPGDAGGIFDRQGDRERLTGLRRRDRSMPDGRRLAVPARRALDRIGVSARRGLSDPGLDSVTASAILDRLSMNGRFIICEGRSYRSKK